ncbi:MAG: T9SS type A sorting domain-containing protein [Crocinitomix sp.]|nr:T9SS type A sorting domain-containing protein [Crocinitomix sp.]
MKKFLLLLVPFYFSLFGFSQSTFVPDDNFEQVLIDLGLDTEPLDDYVPTAAIDTITALYISNRDIIDMTGISDFVNLRFLNCRINDMETLDLSGNILLENLICSNNNLTTLDLSANVLLETLDCGFNTITALDFSENINLLEVITTYNGLETVNFSANTLIERIQVDRNNLENLDVSNNAALKRLVCTTNFLEVIDISANLNLETLGCSRNLITELDLSANENLKNLNCSANLISVLDVTENLNLKGLSCSVNLLNDLNLSENGLLEGLAFAENSITSIDLSNNPLLRSLQCGKNPLTVLDLSENDSLRSISYYETNIIVMDVSHIAQLEELLASSMPDLAQVNVANGNNDLMTLFYAAGCPNLTCITVDADYVTIAEEDWLIWNKDDSAVFSADCESLSVQELSNEITFYPSIFTNFITIRSTYSTEFTVLNLAGQAVDIGSLHNGENRVDLSHLKSGIYLLNLNGENDEQMHKIVKK